MTISVIGLGKIGSAIVPHLLTLGEEVRVWNRGDEARDRMAAIGAVPEPEIQQAFSADIVLSVLFDDAAVREVLTQHVLSRATAGRTLHVCLSTLSPDLVDELARSHSALGIGYLSAPLFGRPEAVREKAAQICVAGDDALVERARPYLETFGRVWHVGTTPRQANVAKLCGNFLIGSAIAAMAEVAGILSREQADPDAFLTLMAETLFSSPIYKNYAPSVTGTRPLPAAGLALPRKDMDLLAAVAMGSSKEAGILSALRDCLSLADAAGLGAEDWSVALGALARQAHS